MQIHEVVYNATLEVVSDATNDDLLAYIHDLKVRQVRLIAIGVDGTVHLFVVANAVTEVEGGLLRILALVIGAGSFDVANVGHDELLIVTLAFDKENLDTVGIASFEDPFPAFLSRVGSIEDTDDAAGAEPREHVSDSSFGGGTALALAFRVVGVEEVSRGLRGIVAPVVSDIERLGRNGKPLQIALRCTRAKQLAKEPKCDERSTTRQIRAKGNTEW